MEKRRNTYQRDVIRQVMKDNYNHPTADQIYDLVKKKDPKISRGTVYRNLAILVENKEIKHYKSPLGPDHYDFHTKPHYHCLCRVCNKLFDANVKYNNKYDSIDLGDDNFTLESHDLIFIGTCITCKN